MPLKSRVKLRSGIRKLKLRGRGFMLSSAEKRAKQAVLGRKLYPEEMRVSAPDTKGNKRASGRGNRPGRKFARAQNQSKGHAPLKKVFRQNSHPKQLPHNPSEAYQPTRESIAVDVRERLYDHRGIEIDNFDVVVSQGQVTLVGDVRSLEDKRQAAEVAREVYGVTKVKNQLHVLGGHHPKKAA